MNPFIKYIKRIQENGITVETVQEIISDHKADHKRMKRLYHRYIADQKDGPKIFNRSPIDYGAGPSKNVFRLDDKVNNMLNNSFDSEIVDTKVGYMFGHPITYRADNAKDTWKQEIQDFLLRSNSADQDAECGKYAAICGYAARLAYIDTEGKPNIEDIEPWHVVFIGKDITHPDYSLYYYRLDDADKGSHLYVEFYDETDVYYFDDESDGLQLKDQKEHLFDYNPLFGVPNNQEQKGDAEKVLSLIDAYDRTLSDASNEIEQYRLAYLVLKGADLDEEDIAKLKKTGIFELYDENQDIKYLNKEVNDDLIEHHLNRLEQNILRYAKSVNFGDEEFAGNQSGVAMRFKLLALENKCINMERKFTSALRYQFKVLCSAWAKKGLCALDDYLGVTFTFTRNLPADVASEATTSAQLQGRVSERTRLSQLSFVPDVDKELEEMQKEKDEYAANLPPVDPNNQPSQSEEGET
jgi:SPP1 family phage portal protein